MNWFIPALVSRSPDSGGGISGEEGTRLWSRASKKRRNVSRIRSPSMWAQSIGGYERDRRCQAKDQEGRWNVWCRPSARSASSVTAGSRRSLIRTTYRAAIGRSTAYGDTWRHCPSGARRVAARPIQLALSVTIVVRLPSLPRNATVSLPTYGSLRWHGKPVSLTNVPVRWMALEGLGAGVGRIIDSIPITDEEAQDARANRSDAAMSTRRSAFISCGYASG